MEVLILGVNGFIGNALTQRIVTATDWHVYGMDLSSIKLDHSLGHPQFHFIEGDITVNKEWIEYHVKKCDVVLPLVAIATPATYVREPLRVFELDFEENLRIVRHCVKYHRRLVFPSTSEVYGMCPDEEFSESDSTMVYGPIHKQRWIYACSKQLMDRVIAAYGQQEGLRYTCFRPFNWIGPRLDDIYAAKEGSSRVVTQKRAFTWLEDGLDALMRILENREGICDGEIFNIGNPDNECSVADLAMKLAAIHDAQSDRIPGWQPARWEVVSADDYFGKGYQDLVARKPSIEKARRLLDWNPATSLDIALERTYEAFVEDWLRTLPQAERRVTVR